MNKNELNKASEALAKLHNTRTTEKLAESVKAYADELGAEILRETVAALVKCHYHDGRINDRTKAAALDIQTANACGEYVSHADDIHPAQLDQLAAYVFKHFDELKAEEETTSETLEAGDILEAVRDRLDKEPQTDTGADFCADYGASDSDYICDAFSEFADGRTDIYNSDLIRWAVEGSNADYIDEARAEGLTDGADFWQQIRGGQYLQYERELYDDMRAIVQTLARDYLADVLNAETTTPDKLADALDDLADALDRIDNNNRLDDIADACDDFIKALTNDGAEA